MMAPDDSLPRGTVLVVDDEPLKRITLQIELTEAGYQVYETAEPKVALRVLESKPIDVVVTDLKMPGMDGLTFLEHVKQRRPSIHVILMTAFGTVDTAVAAMKRGAYDYLTKPFTTDVLLSKLDQLLAYRQNVSGPGDRQHAESGRTPQRLGRLVGLSHAMRYLFQQIRTVADSEGPVLITGERGTGKELVAEAIHELSRRNGRPLVKFSGAAPSPETVESDLFGHENGFSNAEGTHVAGRLESGCGGTLLLEDVDRIPMGAQVKLLRVIETGTIEPMGGKEARHIDVRLICATRSNLGDMVKDGQFRQDLYYRLNVVNLLVPPLRDRREDLPVLADDLIDKAMADAPSRERPRLSPHALDLLVGYDWPGNVRELENVVQRALASCDTQEIRPEHVPPLGDQEGGGRHVIPFADLGGGLTETVASIERRMIESALVQSDYNQAKAAQILGIPRTTLRDKIAKYGLGAGPYQGGMVPPS
ncbi:MAG: sigma-54-dependent Fis family transcriptional regulator [Phycisphaerae bacterium]|nr:sigma-54-dependent Fis family transcriptional regulator [Phycisphaerae bacterium]